MSQLEVFVEYMDTRLDVLVELTELITKKLTEKLDKSELEAIEDKIQATFLVAREHSWQLNNHEQRIKKVEATRL